MYRRVLEAEPTHVGAMCNLGCLELRRRNDTVTAEELYRRAIATAPEDPALLGNLGLALHQRAMQQAPGARASAMEGMGVKTTFHRLEKFLFWGDTICPTTEPKRALRTPPQELLFATAWVGWGGGGANQLKILALK